MIKRCNDFGAGGVSVAIGELADGLRIDLDAVPKKYDGLDGTELAISESQERMAVVRGAGGRGSDSWRLREGENLEATVVADVTAEKRLRMTLERQAIVDISREFLNSNGARKTYRRSTSARGQAVSAPQFRPVLRPVCCACARRSKRLLQARPVPSASTPPSAPARC